MKIIDSTNFSYLGDRNYVNSASIIEFIHSNIGAFVDGLPIDYSLDIKMHKEMNTNCSVEVYSSFHEYSDEVIICEAILKSNCDTKFVYFLSNNEVVNKNDINPVYCVEELDLYSEFSGCYRISSNNYNECIANIIQANKELHLKNIDSKRSKVLNMFMKNIPVEFSKYKSLLIIEIKNIGVRDMANSSFSTLNKITFSGVNLQPVLVGFQVVVADV